MFCMIASFNFNLANFATLAEAERHYLDYHVPLARRLPGLRQYLIGRAADFGPSAADRHRAALLAFDDADALRAAYRSDVGRELRADERRLITDAAVVFVEAQSVLPTQGGPEPRGGNST